jgi:phosphatidate cytidylyltransferase
LITVYVLAGLFGVIFFLTLALDLKKRREREVKGPGEYWLRYITFLFITPAFLIPAWAGRPWFNLLIMGMAAMYVREFFAMTSVWEQKVYRWEGRIFTLLILLGTLLPDKFVFFRIPVLVMMAVLATPVFLARTRDSVRETCLTIVGILYFGWIFSYAAFIRDDFGFGGIVFTAFLVTVDDLACFWVGKNFGRHRLIPQVSPNKTVEGALGGMAFTVAFGMLMRYAVPGFSLAECALLGLVISVAGQIGDLVLSVIKRDMQVKDSGSFLPGHGGMLDRFTSWIFTLPLAFYLMHALVKLGGK